MSVVKEGAIDWLALRRIPRPAIALVPGAASGAGFALMLAAAARA